MKIGWVSASPSAQTGYGRQTYEVCSRLLKRHEVTCIGQVGEPLVYGQRLNVPTPNGVLTVLSLAEPADEIINKIYLPEFHFDIIIGFMDSVPSYSPLLIRSPKTKRTIPSVDVLPIEDLWYMTHGEIHTTERGEEIKTLSEEFEVPIGSNSWTKIRKIIRHPAPANLELLRFNTGGGLLDITANHSVYSKSADPKKNKLVDAGSLKVGQKLSMINVGLREGEGDGEFERLREPLFVGGSDLAWLYGFFAAEGHAGVHNRRAYTVLANTNKEFAESAKSIIESYFHVNVSINPKEREGREVCWRVESNSTNLTKYLRYMFYTGSGEKKIPRSILNATNSVKLAFLRGYNDGDGSQPHRLDEFELFGTTSWCLAEGLSLLTEQVLHRRCSLSWDEKKPKFKQLYVLKNHPKSKEKELIKKVVKVPYQGYLYDLETENHTFTTGVGRFQVHNSFGLEYLNDVKVPSVFWIPIDGPFTDKWRNYMRNAYRVVAYSRYGYGELLKWYPPGKVAYIPHAVDTGVFKPLDEEERALARVELEERHGIPRGGFLAVSNAANVGPRKNLPLLMETWSRFAGGHPNAHLFIHTNAYAVYPHGYDLITWRRMLGMEGNIHFPEYNPILKPATDGELARLYAAADLYVSNSCAEGFGLPLLEAMSCGTPAVAPRNSSQVELVEGHGWLFDNVPEEEYHEIPVYVPFLTEYPAPSQRCLLRKVSEAYANPAVRRLYGRRARRFALRYSWRRVMPRWYAFLEKLEEELKLIKEIEGGLGGLPPR